LEKENENLLTVFGQNSPIRPSSNGIWGRARGSAIGFAQKPLPEPKLGTKSVTQSHESLTLYFQPLPIFLSFKMKSLTLSGGADTFSPQYYGGGELGQSLDRDQIKP
jgi:hypothetical protein